MSRETARTPRQVFGAMLRYYRERAGLTRTDLARQISKSVSLIQAIELGQRAATAEVTRTWSGSSRPTAPSPASAKKSATASAIRPIPPGSRSG